MCTCDSSVPAFFIGTDGKVSYLQAKSSENYTLKSLHCEGCAYVVGVHSLKERLITGETGPVLAKLSRVGHLQASDK